MSRWISARWALLISLSFHVFLVLTVVQLTLPSNPHTLQNILFADIIEEKKTLETKSEPIPVVRKKKEIPPVKKKEKKGPPPLANLQGKTIPPLVGPHEETKAEDLLKEEESSGKQKDLEKSQPQQTEGKNLVKAEKQEESGAPVLGTKASALPLESSPDPGKLPAFKGATWLGEMSGVAKERAGGKTPGKGKNPEWKPHWRANRTHRAYRGKEKAAQTFRLI